MAPENRSESRPAGENGPHAAALDHSLVEHLPINIFRKDRDGRFTFVNRRCADAFGRPADQILGKTDFDFFPHELAEKYRADDARVLATGRTLEFVEENRTPGGEKTYVQVLKTPVRNDRGEVVQTQGLFWDITDRRRAEEALLEERNLLRTLIDNLPGFIFIKDRQSRFVLNNALHLGALGAANREDVLGKTDFDCFPRELAEQYFADDRQVIESGRPLLNREEPLVDRSGKRMWVSVSKVPLRDSRGAVTGLVGMSLDVTARKQAEQALREKEEQLRNSQRMEAVGRVAGGVAHDFDHLLSEIAGQAEMALMKAGADDPARRYLEDIKKAADRGAGLTRRLLDFSQDQIGERKLLDVNRILASMEESLRSAAGPDIRYAAAPGAGLGRVRAEPGQIEEVVRSLAQNAIEAMPGGGTLTIRTGEADLDDDYARFHVGVQPGRYVMLSVIDTGTGMTPETRARLFEPFFSTKAKGQGTGLGLSAVYAMVRRNGGHIDVPASAGKGTTFNIYWPWAEEAANGEAAPAPAAPAERGSGTVLLVEEAKTVRNLISGVLQRSGYRVLEARNAADAAAVAGRFEGDIHLLAVDASAGDSVRRLAASRPSAKILYMAEPIDGAPPTGGSLSPVPVGAPVLWKPFTADSLIQKVREVLDEPVAAGTAK